MTRLPAIAATFAVAVAVVVVPAPAAMAAPDYTNCSTLQATYPHGVGRANARDVVTGTARPVTTWRKDTVGYNSAVSANRGLDRDRDGVTCEKR